MVFGACCVVIADGHQQPLKMTATDDDDDDVDVDVADCENEKPPSIIPQHSTL